MISDGANLNEAASYIYDEYILGLSDKESLFTATNFRELKVQ